MLEDAGQAIGTLECVESDKCNSCRLRFRCYSEDCFQSIGTEIPNITYDERAIFLKMMKIP